MIKRIAIIVVSVSAAILILELGLRYYYWRWNNNLPVPFLLFSKTFPSDNHLKDLVRPSNTDGLVYELKPYLHSTFLSKPFYTNSQGMIGTKEFPLQKTPGTFRIAGVGDSVMSSWGIDPDKTYLLVTERFFTNESPPRRVETLNFSVPGYNTAIELSVIRHKVLQYNPDLIVLGYVGNDMDLPDFIRKKIYSRFYVKYTADQIAKALIQPKSSNILGADTIIKDVPWDVDQRRYVYKIDEAPEEYKYMVGLQNYYKSMKQIADLTISRNIPVVVVAENLERHDKDTYDVNRIAEMGFHIFNVRRAADLIMSERHVTYEQTIISYPDDPHLNALGHDIWGRALYEYLNSSESGYLTKTINK
jgi:lysophospholipase L1-like esterase